MSDHDQIRWSRKSLEELQQYWYRHIEPTLRHDGHDLNDRPTYHDLADHGYSGIAYALREHHNLTLGEFLDTVGYEEHPSETTYQWEIDDETTIQAFEEFLETVEHRRGRSETTVASKRTRLAKYARTYQDIHGSASFVTRAQDFDTSPAETQRAMAVFDRLDQELESAESKLHHLSDLNDFYEYLMTVRSIATYNPVSTFRTSVYEKWTDEVNSERDTHELPALSAQQVSQLVETAETRADQLLVIATCAWGLRRNEVASLHQTQIVLAADDPYLDFAERKNGPSTVTLLYGLETLAARRSELESPDWNGYFFPSTASNSGHLIPDTITNRFKRLAERANVSINGHTPTPQLGRRFWYRAYLDAVDTLYEQIDRIAEEQGSDDSTVIVENYLGDEETRVRRRDMMRNQLAQAFEQ